LGDDPFALPPAPVHFNGQQYDNLPQPLAQQVQLLPALPQPHAQLPHVSFIFFYFYDN